MDNHKQNRQFKHFHHSQERVVMVDYIPGGVLNYFKTYFMHILLS